VKDKRDFPRYDVRIGARYELLSGSPSERHQLSETRDVGLRGCKLITGSRTEIAGLRLLVHPLLPSGEKVSIAGTIAWVQRPRFAPDGSLGEPGLIGVQFHPPTPQEYLQFIAELAAKHTATAPRHVVAPTPRPSRPAEARPGVIVLAAPKERAQTPAERLRAGLRAGRDRKSSPPPRATTSTAPTAPAMRPSVPPRDTDSLGLLPAPETRCNSRPPPPEAVDELLLEFLIDVKTGARPRRPDQELDEQFLDFVLDHQTGSRQRPAGTIPEGAAVTRPGAVSDQEIDTILADHEAADVERLDRLHGILSASGRIAPALPATAVLVVDDDPLVLKAHVRELALAFPVLEASSIAEALALLRGHTEVRAVVTGLVIEEDLAAGLALLHRVQRLAPCCARLLVSSSINQEFIRLFELAGVVQKAIGRPWRPGEVLAAVQELVAKLPPAPAR
jgi:CheY-like chemotaxis protein